MTADLAGIVAEARGLWRRDGALLAPLSGLFLFLPQFALLLLVPPLPPVDRAAGPEGWGKLLEPWVQTYGGWYVVGTLVAQFGALAVVSLYMPPVPTLGRAMARAGLLLPRALLAGLLVTFPCGVALLLSLSVPLLPAVVVPGILYVLARTTLAGAVILAERPIGAAQALTRSWRLTAGRGLPVAMLVGAILVGGQVLGAIVVGLERGVRASSAANPVLLAIVDATAAGVTWAAATALALVQVVLYRRLAR
jgi:hypothetical protein